MAPSTPRPENNLPPFSGDRPRCTSCGHRGAHTEWHPGYPTGNMGPFLSRYCSRCGFFWPEQLAPADDPETTRLTFWQRITRPFRPKAIGTEVEPEAWTGRPTHPDGTPYSYSEITAGGWQPCDGCRQWGQWTANDPHDCPGPYITGPSQADIRRILGEAP